MKQRIFTDYEKYVDHILSNKNTLLTYPVSEIFLFEEDFRFVKITEKEVQLQTKTVFKFKNHIWYYWEEKELQFVEVSADKLIEKLLKPMYDKWYQDNYKTIVNESQQ